jgi:hypothetical protein
VNRLQALEDIARQLGLSLAGWTAEEPDLTELGDLADQSEQLASSLASLPPSDRPEAEAELSRDILALERMLAETIAQRRAELDIAWGNERALAGRMRAYGQPAGEAATSEARYLDDLR